MAHLWPLWMIFDGLLIVVRLFLFTVPYPTSNGVGFAYNRPCENSAHKIALTAADILRLHSERRKKQPYPLADVPQPPTFISEEQFH